MRVKLKKNRHKSEDLEQKDFWETLFQEVH